MLQPYTPDDFEKLVQEFLGQEAKLLNWKAGEYATDEDRLLNFRQVADFRGVRPIDVAWMYAMKHIQSINLVIDSRKPIKNFVWQTPEGEGLKQRLADARNYLLLVAACFDEMAREQKASTTPPKLCPTCKHQRTSACNECMQGLVNGRLTPPSRFEPIERSVFKDAFHKICLVCRQRDTEICKQCDREAAIRNGRWPCRFERTDGDKP